MTRVMALVSRIQTGSDGQKEATTAFVAPNNVFAVTIEAGVTEFSMAILCSVKWRFPVSTESGTSSPEQIKQGRSYPEGKRYQHFPEYASDRLTKSLGYLLSLFFHSGSWKRIYYR